MVELAEALGLDKSSVSGLVDRAEAAAWWNAPREERGRARHRGSEARDGRRERAASTSAAPEQRLTGRRSSDSSMSASLRATAVAVGAALGVEGLLLHPRAQAQDGLGVHLRDA